MDSSITHDEVSCDITTTTINDLWGKYRAKIFTRLLTLTHNRQTAEDLTQETYLRAWRSLPALQSHKNLYGWLYLIATNIARDWYRHEHGKGRSWHMPPISLEDCLINEDGDGYLDIPDERYDPERAVCEKEIMQEALARLNPESRGRLISHFIENKEQETRLLYQDRRLLNDMYELVERGPLPKPGKGKKKQEGGEAA